MSDGRRFDELTRIWARPISRRRALRLTAGVAVGAVASTVFAGRAGAVSCTTNGDCTSGQACISGTCQDCTVDPQCGPGNVCVPLATPPVCVCPATRTNCNTVCCGSFGGPGGCCPNTTDTCCGASCCPTSSTCLGGTTCCPSAQACGSTCCPRSTVCADASTGRCGCPAGAPTCGNFCCTKGETCSDPAAGCCCPKGSTPCGRSCCASGVACIDASQSFCGCPKGTTPCGTGVNLTCCPPGVACTAGCPSPSNNTVLGHCSAGVSDRALKEHVLPVVWIQPEARLTS